MQAPFKTLFCCALLAGFATGQSTGALKVASHAFNVDVGLGPLAQTSCAGDLAQPGVWNSFGVDNEGRMPLVDTLGRATPVVLHADGVSTWVSCNTDQPGGDQGLLGDGAQTLGSTQEWSLSGLAPGRYLLTVYARADCTSGPTRIEVVGEEVLGHCLGRALEPEDAWGRSFVLHANQGRLTVHLTPSSPESEVRLSGLQVQPLGPAPVALLSVGSHMAALRAAGDAPLSAPSCAPLHPNDGAGLVLSGGPVGIDFNVLSPARAPIQTYLAGSGWHPDSCTPHAAMQWAGVQFWWQLGARDGSLGSPTWLWQD